MTRALVGVVGSLCKVSRRLDYEEELESKSARSGEIVDHRGFVKDP